MANDQRQPDRIGYAATRDLVVRNMQQVGSPLDAAQAAKPTMDFHADPSLFYAIQKYQDARQLIAKTYMADKAPKPKR